MSGSCCTLREIVTHSLISSIAFGIPVSYLSISGIPYTRPSGILGSPRIFLDRYDGIA